MNRAAFVGGILLCAVGMSSAQVQQGGPGFVETPGVMEFSGRVIVKPLQAEALRDRGLDVQATYRVAVANLARFQEYTYEPLVDHYVLMVPSGSSENEVIGQLLATGLYEFAEPDWTLYPIGCPNDTFPVAPRREPPRFLRGLGHPQRHQRGHGRHLRHGHRDHAP